MTESSPALLELAGISKSFGGVQALREVDFTLRAGEIHGLVGENGAGKSTLMKIIAGVHSGYSGTMRIEGRDVQFRSARDALAAGIGMVHQELSIAPDLTVAEKVFLGMQPPKGGVVDWKRMVRESREHLAGLGIDVDPRVSIGSLSIGLQQLIEIARVLFSGARIIILDEPTSALSPPEVERLFGVLRSPQGERPQLRIHLALPGRHPAHLRHGHVFRNGRKIVTSPTTSIDKRWVIEQMIGKGMRSWRRAISARSRCIRSRMRRSSCRRRTFPGSAISAVCPWRSGPERCSASTDSWAAACWNWRAPCSARSSRRGL
jgi:ribose transport system ATP-binding protein